jgi:cysteinyl-tRNA synthetase
MLNIYNTLTKQVEPIEKKGHINLYTCGPTVYNYAHIGNLRSYIVADSLYRALKYQSYHPRWVMNITDIDDKTIKGAVAKFGANASVENLREFTSFFTDEFFKDLDEANVLREEIEFIRVTDVIPQIQEFIVGLMAKGYAYKAEDGSTYFSIEKYQNDFGDYGQLVGEKFIQGKKVGARVAVDEYEKDNLSDFALWKAYVPETDAQIFWDHPLLGKGRPGWHIECSAINHFAFKNEPTDIHTGGVDLIFPHHTNEIAQSQGLLGKGKFVKHWVHSEHLLVDGKKMAKSSNNFFTVRDLQSKIPIAGLALRYSFAQSNYRAQQNFTEKSFLAAYNSLEKIYNILKSHKIIGQNQELNKEAFDEAVKLLTGDTLASLGNDLNLPSILSNLWLTLGADEIGVNTQDKIAEEFNKILGFKLSTPPNIFDEIEVPEEIKQLAQARAESRSEKDFAKSDELRKQIESAGYEIMDTADGQKVKKKISI